MLHAVSLPVALAHAHTCTCTHAHTQGQCTCTHTHTHTLTDLPASSRFWDLSDNAASVLNRSRPPQRPPGGGHGRPGQSRVAVLHARSRQPVSNFANLVASRPAGSRGAVAARTRRDPSPLPSAREAQRRTKRRARGEVRAGRPRGARPGEGVPHPGPASPSRSFRAGGRPHLEVGSPGRPPPRGLRPWLPGPPLGTREEARATSQQEGRRGVCKERTAPPPPPRPRGPRRRLRRRGSCRFKGLGRREAGRLRVPAWALRAPRAGRARPSPSLPGGVPVPPPSSPRPRLPGDGPGARAGPSIREEAGGEEGELFRNKWIHFCLGKGGAGEGVGALKAPVRGGGEFGPARPDADADRDGQRAPRTKGSARPARAAGTPPAAQRARRPPRRPPRVRAPPRLPPRGGGAGPGTGLRAAALGAPGGPIAGAELRAGKKGARAAGRRGGGGGRGGRGSAAAGAGARGAGGRAARAPVSEFPASELPGRPRPAPAEQPLEGSRGPRARPARHMRKSELRPESGPFGPQQISTSRAEPGGSPYLEHGSAESPPGGSPVPVLAPPTPLPAMCSARLAERNAGAREGRRNKIRRRVAAGLANPSRHGSGCN